MNLLIRNILSLIIICKMIIFTSLALAQTTDSENTEQNPEAVLSTVEEIINNEEFVLQSLDTDRYFPECILESPSAVWSISFCEFGEVQEGYVTDRIDMSGRFTIKNTGTEILYKIDQPGPHNRITFDAYRTIAQDPSFLIREQQSPSDRKLRNRRSIYLYYLYLTIYPNGQQKDKFEDRIEVTFTEPMLPILQNLARIKKQLIEMYGYRKQKPKQQPKVILSTVEEIINNEEFVLQDIHPTSGHLNSLTCIYESPSAAWFIKYCDTDNEHLAESGHWNVAMAAEFSIKDTDIKLNYYFERGNVLVDIYKAIERDPSFFIGEQSMWIRMNVYANERESGEVAFTEPMLPILQNLARVQKQLIAQSTQLDEQRRTAELAEQVTQVLLEQSPQIHDEQKVREQARQLVQSTQINEQRVAELIELIRLQNLLPDKNY